MTTSDSRHDNKIRFFHSFEEMEEARARAVANQDPVERLRGAVELILRVYRVSRDTLRQRTRSNRIKFIS